jgi:hypothetical protein
LSLTQDSLSPGRDLKPGSPKYEVWTLSTAVRRSGERH